MNNKENYILLREIVNEIDPVGLVDFDTPESLNEYEPELSEILQEDISLLNSQQLSQRIHAVFVRFFNEELAGPKDNYNLIANKFLYKRNKL